MCLAPKLKLPVAPPPPPVTAAPEAKPAPKFQTRSTDQTAANPKRRVRGRRALRIDSSVNTGGAGVNIPT